MAVLDPNIIVSGNDFTQCEITAVIGGGSEGIDGGRLPRQSQFNGQRNTPARIGGVGLPCRVTLALDGGVGRDRHRAILRPAQDRIPAIGNVTLAWINIIEIDQRACG